MHHLRLIEKFVPWKRDDGFDRSEVLAETQCGTQGRVCWVDDPEHSKTEVYFGPWWPPSPQKLTESM